MPRPPLWLNLTLLLAGLAIAAIASMHHRTLERRFATVVARGENTPAELRKLRADLAAGDLTRDELQQKLAAESARLEVLQTDRFYISIDSAKKRFQFYFGNELLRDAPAQIGPPATLAAGDKKWTFAALKGETTVQGKSIDAAWTPAPWAYALTGQTPPASPAPVASGLGKYVIELPNGYLIHSPPPPDSPLKGPKPGSFVVPEEDLRAIWPRVTAGMRVYVY